MDVLSAGGPWAAAARWLLLAALLGYSAASPLSFAPPSISPERAAHLRADLDQNMADKHWVEALYEAQALLRYFPQDSTFLSREAHIYDALGDFKSESRVYELALRFSPEPTESCPALGQSYARQGLPEKALDADRRCLQLQPGNSDMRLYYALALERNGRLEEAKKAFELVLQGAPDYADARNGLRRVEAHLNAEKKK